MAGGNCLSNFFPFILYLGPSNKRTQVQISQFVKRSFEESKPMTGFQEWLRSNYYGHASMD